MPPREGVSGALRVGLIRRGNATGGGTKRANPSLYGDRMHEMGIRVITYILHSYSMMKVYGSPDDPKA